MTNFESGEKLFKEARQIKKDLERALEDESWNLAVRRAQEVVELSLKALLKIAGVEYPKSHDVGDLVAQILREKGLKIPEETLARVKEISASLAEKRAPAFYMEKEYTKEEAREAKEKEKWVFEFATKVKGKLEGGDEGGY